MNQHHQKKWVVVQFLEDCTVSTVPGKWLKFQKGDLVDSNLECFWPSKKTRHKIQNAFDPKEDWPTYHVKILHETDDYDEAKSYEKTLSGDESPNTLDEQTKIGSRKRKIVRNSEFVSGESSSEEEESCKLPPLPKTPKLGDGMMGEKDDCNNSSNTSSTISVTDEIMADIDRIIMPPPSTTRILRPIQLEYDNQQDCCCVHVKRLNENVVALKTKLGELTSNLQKVISTQQRAPQAEQINEFDTIPEKAFGKYKNLMKYEDSLKNSESARKQLETLFFISGGDNVLDIIKRGLKRIFNNKLATKCSWFGRKDNYPLEKLILISILKDAARKRFAYLTDSEFEKTVSTWFRQAALRFKREKTMKNNQIIQN